MSHSASQPGGEVFNRAMFFDNMMEDTDLIRDLVQSLSQSWPASEAELQAAIAAGDAPQLDKAAHKIRGSVSAFFAGPARDTTARMEALGRSGSVAGAQAMLDQLRREMVQLLTALKAL